jgi:hypothetical protein
MRYYTIHFQQRSSMSPEEKHEILHDTFFYSLADSLERYIDFIGNECRKSWWTDETRMCLPLAVHSSVIGVDLSQSAAAPSVNIITSFIINSY